MDVMFEHDPECEKIFRSSISGVTTTSTNDCLRYFFSCPGPYVGSDVVGLPAIPYAMLLTILLYFGMEDVSDVLVDPECPTSCQLDSGRDFCRSRNGSDCISL